MENTSKQGKTEKPAMGINRYLRDVLGYPPLKRAEELDVGLRTIERWDAKDRGRDCATHVYTSVTEMIDLSATGQRKNTMKLVTRRCRYCGYAPPQERTFFHVSWGNST